MRNKKLVYYSIKLASDPLKILSVVTSKKEAEEFINKLLYLEHIQDFDSWCFYKEIPDNEKQNHWIEYFNTRLSKEEKNKYVYYKIIYRYTDLAVILRMFCGCKPIGCSFDTKDEYSYISAKSYIKQVLDKNLNTLKEALLNDDTEGETIEKEDDIVQ